MTKYNFLFFLPVVFCLLLSCSKDHDVSGPPIINGVSLLDSTKTDSTFARALPGTLILITGENLSGAVTVSFNGQSAYFNPTYNTSTHIIMTIPSNAPTEATDPNVPNKIRIVTNHGETAYSFVIDIPPPAIWAISNENAMPGDSLIIRGANLWLIEKLVFPGGREITDFAGNDAGSRVGLLMPDLGTDTGRLVIVAKFGTTWSDGPLNDHQSGDVISNLTNAGEAGEDPVFNWGWWGANRTSDATLFPGTRGAYLQNIFGGVGAKDVAWWNGNRSGNFSDVSTIFTAAVMSEQASNYALKFEINTKEPWTAGVNVLRLGDNYAYRYMPWADETSGSFNTGNTWETVTVLLSDFKTAAKDADGNTVEGTGAGAMTMGNLLKTGGVVAFGYRFITEAAAVDVYNAAYDNFRIVKVK
ncbi:hypothetical protein SAMN05428988_5607 [Chitinophaga sp. YR573]|uniref:glycan-binding surface protein n=1 Tax=Chitinophaga sp. YR573 TaxID=1881040 RepID=UPI0008B7F3F4|nr:glycan-binding surface protein [Chitinophaga sp. YR573]SEW43684.1 hypothetical protein SAMN05428988_5607 [Chitinophaga sp. YR573]